MTIPALKNGAADPDKIPAAVREAYRQAGIKLPGPTAASFAEPFTATPLRLDALLRSMALVGAGILIGYGGALLAVYLNGKF